MPSFTIQEVQTHLPQLLENLKPGEEIVITRDDNAIARLIVESKPGRRPRRPGTLRGTVLYMAPDFNAPLAEFKEYMP